MKERSDRQKMHGRFIKITISTVLIGIALIVASCMGIYSIRAAN